MLYFLVLGIKKLEYTNLLTRFKMARMIKDYWIHPQQTRSIVTIQHPSDMRCLRQKSTFLIPPFDQEIQKIIQLMIEALKIKGGGAGLAAPQIGINKRLILCSFNRKIEDLEPMINPEYEPIGNILKQTWEGCFSVPLTFGKIPRWQAIKASYYTPQGDKIEKVLQGLAAKIYQHEYDHLEGVLIVDKANELKTFGDEEEYKNFLKIVREEDSRNYRRNSAL